MIADAKRVKMGHKSWGLSFFYWMFGEEAHQSHQGGWRNFAGRWLQGLPDLPATGPQGLLVAAGVGHDLLPGGQEHHHCAWPSSISSKGSWTTERPQKGREMKEFWNCDDFRMRPSNRWLKELMADGCTSTLLNTLRLDFRLISDVLGFRFGMIPPFTFTFLKLFIEGNIAKFRSICGYVHGPIGRVSFCTCKLKQIPRSWDRSIVVHDESSKTEVVHRRATNSHKARRFAVNLGSTIQNFLGVERY